MQIKSILEDLSKIRPIFHSEADFQHALAWRIREGHPYADIRLEYPVKVPERRRMYIDILIKVKQVKYAIELKYKTRKLELKLNDEQFHLTDQSAQDIARYDYLKDIQRLERLVDDEIIKRGYAVFLTNDPRYWQKSSRETIDAQFRIHEARKIPSNNSLMWSKDASEGTKKGREESITIGKELHVLSWKKYSESPVQQDRAYNDFRYLVVEIK